MHNSTSAALLAPHCSRMRSDPHSGYATYADRHVCRLPRVQHTATCTHVVMALKPAPRFVPVGHHHVCTNMPPRLSQARGRRFIASKPRAACFSPRVHERYAVCAAVSQRTYVASLHGWCADRKVCSTDSVQQQQVGVWLFFCRWMECQMVRGRSGPPHTCCQVHEFVGTFFRGYNSHMEPTHHMTIGVPLLPS